MTPDVSVILCSYNQARFLPSSIESVLGQTHKNLELVIVENGSSDDSVAVARRYLGDPRVRLLAHEKNAAVTTRLNDAIRQSRGTFLSLIYSDDDYLPQKLERQLQAFAGPAHEAGVVHGPGYRLNVTTGAQWVQPVNRAHGWAAHALFIDPGAGGINPISPLVRRECYEQMPFDERVFIEGEFIYNRMSTRYKFFYLDEPLVLMRDHDRNEGKNIRRNIERLMEVLDAFERSGDVSPSLLPDVRRYRARVLRDAGWQGIRVFADPSWARQCFGQMALLEPAQMLHPRSVAGLTLSALPPLAIRVFNRAFNRVRRTPGHTNGLEH